MHYTSPDEFIFISNILGETKLYFPKKNEVLIQQKDVFSAETDILFLFFTQNMSEMGLKNIGFQIISTKAEGDYLITKWSSPMGSKSVSEIELVYNDYVPIYTSFISSANKPLNKTYYGNYTEFKGNYIPLRITEITYLATGDSIVSRKDYSDLKFGNQVQTYLLNFKIPNNAKVVK
jgi:hypothetical protein